MVKFSSEIRIQVVQEYLTGKGTTYSLSKKYGIAAHTTVLNWVHRYEKFGIEAFKIIRRKEERDGRFKAKVLEWRHKNRASLKETALHFNISNTGTISNWQKKFDEGGIEALYKRRGRPRQMIKNHKENHKETKELSELERLQEENKLLKIENEYLKKLRALIQEPNHTDKSKRK